MTLKPFVSSTDRTPKYTVKEVAEMFELSPHAIRYYENNGLIPFVDRTDGNIRMFSDYSVSWLRLVHCLRATGLPIEQVKEYVYMCLEGDSTIQARATLIFQQEANLREQIRVLQQQMVILKYKKKYYKELIAKKNEDSFNPKHISEKQEPHLLPQKQA